MDVCKTDIQNAIRLLGKSAELIDKHCQKPCDLDKARQCRNLSKKLKKKLNLLTSKYYDKSRNRK